MQIEYTAVKQNICYIALLFFAARTYLKTLFLQLSFFSFYLSSFLCDWYGFN